jgi:hypothetical protein
MPRRLSAVDGGSLLLLLSTELEVLATSNVLHLEGAALLALHLQCDLLGNLGFLVEHGLLLWPDCVHDHGVRDEELEYSDHPKTKNNIWPTSTCASRPQSIKKRKKHVTCHGSL